MKKKLFLLSNIAIWSPVLAFAQGGLTGVNPTSCTGVTSITDLQGFICKLGDIVGAIIPLIVAIGVLYFVWGVVQFVIADDEEAKTTGRNRMIYGIIGLVVIVGLWGLVRFITNTFGLSNSTNITYPNPPR